MLKKNVKKPKLKTVIIIKKCNLKKKTHKKYA